jgi:TMEM175 potassium channel family protein
MSKSRLEAFSDGVIAIIITIMVLELKVPKSAELGALEPMLPVLLGYVLSFTFVGIYWNNHHHLLQVATGVTGKVLWANLHLLFWLSLIPLTTAWTVENPRSSWPAALYGAVLLLAGIAYLVLQRTILALPGVDPKVAAAFERDRKGPLSAALYASAIGLAFVHPWISDAIYVLVALVWLVPERRIESRLAA